jgi:hypothetical protein
MIPGTAARYRTLTMIQYMHMHNTIHPVFAALNQSNYKLKMKSNISPLRVIPGK